MIVCDVGPRDGLQNEPETLEPAVRAELVSRLASAGLPRVEAVSFVRDDRVPQMAGAEAVAERLPRGATELSGLVLNERGYERFRETGLDRVNLTLAATDSFSRRNANASRDEALAEVARLLSRAEADGIPTTVTVSVAFGCPFEGAVDPDACWSSPRVWAVRARSSLPTRSASRPRAPCATWSPGRLRRAEPSASTATTPATPATRTHWPRWRRAPPSWTPRSAGSEAARSHPRATGNVATEDLVYLLEGEGIATGVDLDALVAVSEWLSGVLGRTLPGYVYRAGPATTPAANSRSTSSGE